mmetsp:Transcript_97340/g.172341  ORF Transcript_97340/g.172341 Transcript_97340/m.172341 type:complete len:434 (+) Transcript_97340:104-1405(+)
MASLWKLWLTGPSLRQMMDKIKTLEPEDIQNGLMEAHSYLYQKYGRQAWVCALVYIFSGWGLRQIGHLHPRCASVLYGKSGVPGPPLIESILFWVVFKVSYFGLYVVSGAVALALASFLLFAWTTWSQSVSLVDLKQRYGQGSWAAVLMSPQDPLGIAFCFELSRAGFNLLVISESGMRGVCETLQKTSGVQVQPFEVPLTDTQKITKAWSHYDISLVVFVTPRESSAGTHAEQAGLLETMSFVGQGATIAEKVFAAVLPKLCECKPSSASSSSSSSHRRGLICTTSLCGMFPVPGRTAQCAADAATLALAMSLSTELRPQGVDVVCAPCLDLFAVDPKQEPDMMGTAQAVLAALGRGQKLCFGVLRQAAKAWALDALPACLRQWLFDEIWKRLCKMREDKLKKQQEAEAGSSSDVYAPSEKAGSETSDKKTD